MIGILILLSMTLETRTCKHTATPSNQDIWILKNYVQWLKKLTQLFFAANANKNILISFPQEFRWNKNSSQEQVNWIDWSQSPSNMGSTQLAYSPCKLQHHYSQDQQDCWLHNCPRSKQHPNPRQKWSGKLQRFSHFCSWTSSSKCNSGNKHSRPFQIDPKMLTRLAIKFDKTVEDDKEWNSTATIHPDDLNAWLYGIKRGLIPETRYTVIPDNNEAAIFFNNHHAQCITNANEEN